MKAEKDERTHLLTLTVPNPDEPGKPMRIPGTPKYREFCMCIGWLDPSGRDDYGRHALVVVAELEDKTYSVFSEAQANLAEIVRVAIEAKDCLLIQRTFVDPRDEASVRYLRNPDTADGLIDYELSGDPEDGRAKYVRESSTWPSYRDRDTVTALIPIAEELLTNPGTAYDVFRHLAGRGQLSVGEECPKTAIVLKGNPPLEDMFRHPTFKAAAMCVSMMERTRERDEGRAGKGLDPWYSNLR